MLVGWLPLYYVWYSYSYIHINWIRAITHFESQDQYKFLSSCMPDLVYTLVPTIAILYKYCLYKYCLRV